MYTDVDCPGAAGSGVKVLLAVGVPDPVAKALDYLQNDCKMYIQVHSHACMHSFMHVLQYISSHTHTHTNTHTHRCIYTQIYIYIYIYIYICIIQKVIQQTHTDIHTTTYIQIRTYSCIFIHMHHIRVHMCITYACTSRYTHTNTFTKVPHIQTSRYINVHAHPDTGPCVQHALRPALDSCWQGRSD